MKADGYVFTEDEALRVRKVLGGMPFGATVRRPVSQVGSLAVLIEWLEDLSATLQAGAGLRAEEATELDARRRDDEAIRRFLARVLPKGES